MRTFLALCAAILFLDASVFAQNGPADGGSPSVLRRLSPEEYTRIVSRTLPSPVATAQPAGPADLVATGVVLATAPGGDTLIPAPGVGEAVYINFLFENQGTGTASNFTMEISIDGYVYCPYSGPIDAPPGSAWTFSCPNPWLPLAGLHQIAGRVDVTNTVPESNELNNTVLRIVPVPISLTARSYGVPPGSSVSDVWFSARHKEAAASWFVAPNSGILDTLWWVMGDSVGANDSVIIVSVRRSRVSGGSGPGSGYPAPPTSWGRWANTNDADQGIAPFPEEATDTAWVSTVGGGKASFPPVAEERLPSRPVTVHRNGVAALSLAAAAPGLLLAKGETLFVSLRVNSANAHVADAPTMFAAARALGGTPSRLWKFYEHDAVSSGFSKGWVARGEFNLLLWYSMTAVPRIASFTPQSAPRGSVVTIAGSGFAPSPESTLVRFGGVRSELLAATETTLTALVPPGGSGSPISVTNLSTHRTGVARGTFSATFPVSRLFDEHTFEPPRQLGGELSQVRFLAAGDIDADGKPDLALADEGGVKLFRNTAFPGVLGAASFAPPMTLDAPSPPFDPILADFDGDGRLDLAASCGDAQSVGIARNTSVPGSFTFEPMSSVSAPAVLRRACAADIDGDGRLDIVAGSYAGLQVFRNLSVPGLLSFAAPAALEPGMAPQAVAAADMDGDGKTDLCFVDPGGSVLSIVRNSSAPGVVSSASRLDVPTGVSAYGVSAGDIDGDGRPDVAVQTATGGIRVFRNASAPGALSLGPPADLPTGGGGNDCRLSDLNGDGKPDLAGASDSGVRVFRNRAVPGVIDGSSFDAGVDVSAGGAFFGFLLCDLDGDAQPDLAGSHSADASVGVLRNAMRCMIIRGYDRPANTFSAGPVLFHATLLDDYPEHPESALVASAELRYSVNGVPQSPLPMTHGAGSEWSAEIPGAPPGSYVDYRLRATNARGGVDSTLSQRYHVVALATADYVADTGAVASPMPAHASALDSMAFSAPGADQALAHDNGTAGPVSLGGAFPFYGELMHYAWVGIDGAVSLSAGASDTADINSGGSYHPSWNVPWPVRPGRADSPPGGSLPGFLVSPFYHDAALSSGGALRIASNENLFAVEWDSLSGKDSSGAPAGRPHVRLLLNKANGTMEFQYLRTGGSILEALSFAGMEGGSGKYHFLFKGATPSALRPRDGWCVRLRPARVVHASQQGWNLISVPSLEASMAKTALFPTAVSEAYQYQNGYVSSPALECGRGYWLKFPAETATRYDGEETIAETVSVAAGWNIIGSISRSVEVASIASIPPGIPTSQFFAYRGGYAASPTIDPGRAYWVKTPVDAQLILASGAGGEAVQRIVIGAVSELPPPPPAAEGGPGERALPREFSLGQNYPNPFNATTIIQFALPSAEAVRLSLYNVLGEEVAVIVDETRPAGVHTAYVNADHLPSGMFFCRLRAGAYNGARKILLIR